MGRSWVLNSSPIIILSKVSLEWIIRELTAEFVIPAAVAREITQGSEWDPARKWIDQEGREHVRTVGDVELRVLRRALGPGESEVITWADRNTLYEAIIDDRAARRCALDLGLPVRGTIGVLLTAKKEGLIPALSPVLHSVKDSGLRMSDALLDKALLLAGEL